MQSVAKKRSEQFFYFILRFRISILIFFILITALSFPLVLKLRLQSKLTEILPDSIPQAKALQRQIENYATGGAGYYFLIEAPTSKDVLDAARVISDSLNTYLPNARVIMGIDSSFMNEQGLWLMPSSVLEKFARHCNGMSASQILSSINDIVEQDSIEAPKSNTSNFQNPTSWIRSLIDYLMIVISPALTQEMVAQEIQKAISGSPILLSADGKKGFLSVIQTDYSTSDKSQFYFAKKLAYYAQKLSTSTVTLSVAGSVMLSFEESQFLIQNLLRGVIGTIIATGIFLFFVYRDWKIIGVITVTMIISLILSISVISLITGGVLHITTGTFLLLIIGLGLDFVVHFIDTCQGETPIAKAMVKKLPSVFVAAGSTCIVFLCLLLTGLAPLQQLGWVVSVGLSVTLVVTAILVPIIVSLCKLKNVPDVPKKNTFWRIQKSRSIHTVLIGFCILSSIIGGYFLFSNKIETDIRKLDIVTLPSDIALKKLIRYFNMTPAPLSMIVSNRDSLQATIQILQQDPLVKSVQSPLNLIPSRETIPATKNYLTQIRNASSATNPNSLNFKKEIHRLLLNLTDFSQVAYMQGNTELHDYLYREINDTGRLHVLDSMLNSSTVFDERISVLEQATGTEMKQRILRLTTSEPFTMNTLPAFIKERFFPKDLNSKECLIYVNLHRDIWQPDVFKKVQTYLSKTFPTLTGVPILSHLIVSMVLNRGFKALCISMILCFVFLFLYLASLKKTCLGMVPIILGIAHCGYIFMCGTLYTIPLMNYMSICSLPLIIGIGLDYSVYALASSNEHSNITKRAIITSGITSILSFLGLATCNHAGLIGLGLCLSIGLSICILCALFFLTIKQKG